MLDSVYDLIEKPKNPNLTIGDNGAQRAQLESSKLTSAPLIQKEPAQPKAAVPNIPVSANVTANSGGGFMSNYGGMIGQGLSAVGNAIPKKNEFNNENYQDKTQVEEDTREQSVGAVKDTVSSVFGPWGMLFRGIEKAGNAVGDGIGGKGGAVVSSIFSPDEAIMANNSDPDVKTGDKILGSILPMYGAISSYKAKKKRKDALMLRQQKEALNMTVADREAEQRMQEGLEQIAAEKKVLQSQLGLTSNY